MVSTVSAGVFTPAITSTRLHTVCGIEEVHTDQGTRQTLADLGNGKAGSVGSKYTLGLADLVQLTEGGLLNFHILKCSFYDQIAVCTQIVPSGPE